jgi:Ca2+-binding RTX toxin-like protein
MPRSFFEPLENRQMMSATLKNGVLTIEGTDLGNVIAVSQDRSNVRVNEDGKVTTFAVGSVKSVVVNVRGGNDQLIGRTNLTKPMTLRGGAGTDLLIGGAKGDVFEGGPDSDLVDYSHRNQSFNISLDNVANDGATDDPGTVVEKDNVKIDVERIKTGNGNDLLRGSDANNVIDAGNGLDTVYGMGGNDTLIVAGRTLYEPDTVYGGEGDDLIETTGARAARLTAYGEGGNDQINGSAINDTLDGGAGTDTINGQEGNDEIHGGSWRDHLFGGPGDDLIRGGSGDDIIEAGDGDDTVWGDVPPLLNAILKGTKIGGGVILGGPITGNILITPVSDSDVINGGAGNDALHGGDDKDTVSGGAGHDKLWGDAGDDAIRGNGGNDSCYGGDGNDNISGDEDNDLIVSIGGGALDTLWGDAGADNFWADAEESEIIRDADLGEALFGGVKRVAAFMNGVSRNLYGQNLPDPDASYYQKNAGVLVRRLIKRNPPTNNFKDSTFVGNAGVSESDVEQGQVGDCWLMSVLAAAAKFAKIRLTTSMVDLGDGTYAFRLIDDAGNHRFVRVDADLPVDGAGSTTPRYAGLGKSFTTWAALFEKAYATFKGVGYMALAGGDVGGAKGAAAALGMRDAGFKYVEGNGVRALEDAKAAMAQGKIVTLSTPDRALGAASPVVKNHAYVVERVNTITIPVPNGLGGLRFIEIVVSATLRNPWGTDGPGTTAADGSDDGLVTVSATDIGKYISYSRFAWA